MVAKAKLISSLVLVLFTLVLFAGLAIAKQDPELKQCQHQCRVQQQFDEEQKQECERKCEDYHKEKKKRESEERGGCDDDWSMVNSGKVTLRHCREQCERLDQGEERQLCRLRCQQRWGGHEDEGEEEEGEKHENPYVFEDRHFSTAAKTEQGRVDLLAKFTDKSELLRGIEDYRLAVLVANPNSFVVPNHFDADAVFVVTQGRGRIALIHEDKRESFNIERGDIIRVRAGTPIYLINNDDYEKLFIVKLLKPVSLPGEYEVFYGAAGGENPAGSFFRAFSTAILEAEFKVSADKLEEFFEKQDEGPFLKATKEQIQAMSRRKEEGGGGGGIWPFRGDSKDAFNIFRKRRPSQANKYGQLFEVDADQFEPLKEFNLRVTYANITKGCMTALQYNSRATKIAIVVAGEGHFEMACPHVTSKSRSYRKISSPLRLDTVFVVPPSHPFVTVASRNENLELLCFEVNVENNIRYPLTGKGNIVQQFEKEAKELAFKTKEEQVDRIFNSQDEEFFLPGPRQQRGRASE